MAKNLLLALSTVFALSCILPSLAFDTSDIAPIEGEPPVPIESQSFAPLVGEPPTTLMGDPPTTPLVEPSAPIVDEPPAAVEGGFIVEGRVFCDTCRAGFETPMSTYVEGAKVRVECRNRAGEEVCSFEGTTDDTGKYSIQVHDEHEHETCESVLVSSPEVGCQTPLQGRDRAPVFLSHNTGIDSDTRFVNALGVVKDTPTDGCAQLLKSYELYN